MELNDILDQVRNNTIVKLLNTNLPGDDLNKVYFNIIQIKEILYSTLKDIEIQHVKDKWNGF